MGQVKQGPISMFLLGAAWGLAVTSHAGAAWAAPTMQSPGDDYQHEDGFVWGQDVPSDDVSSDDDGDVAETADDGGGEDGETADESAIEATPTTCRWQTIENEESLFQYFDAVEADVPPRPSPTAVLQVEVCGAMETTGLMSVEWVEPGEEGDPTADLLDTVYARVAGNLPVPELGANPRLGGAAVVNWPTFVRVENWTGVFTDQGCNGSGDFCVYVEATPTMTFDPGDGSDPVECQGQGELYDPGSVESPWEQAEWDETCTHIYRQRTGVDGRPEAWPGVVSVTWAITYTSDSGDSGTLEPVTHSADLAREVQERQAIVTD